MKKIIMSILLTSCSTLDQTVRLGSSLGSITGASTVLVGASVSHTNAKVEDVLVATGIGAIVGTALSFLIYKQLDKERIDYVHQTEVQFGDLPQNPFQFSISATRGGK